MQNELTRRSFLSLAGSAAIAMAMPKVSKVPVGIELFSVRNELAKDLPGTLRAIAKMGYQTVEFFSPYYQWTPDYAKEVRTLMDELKISCPSTHNSASVFTPENLPKAIELNQIIGSKTIVMASAGRVEGIDGWKGVAGKLTMAAEKLKPLGMRAGFHNHQTEFQLLEGQRPIEVLAANTPKDVTMQLDVGTCIHAGIDPVDWVNANPGRIRSMHLKDWAPGEEKEGKGYRVLFGEGVTPWQKLFAVAEAKGGIENYLIEQEGSRFAAFETAEKCLATFKKLRA